MLRPSLILTASPFVSSIPMFSSVKLFAVTSSLGARDLVLERQHRLVVTRAADRHAVDREAQAAIKRVAPRRSITSPGFASMSRS
jgi:hypothetical protein